MSIFTYLKVANNTRDLEGIQQMSIVTYFEPTTLNYYFKVANTGLEGILQMFSVTYFEPTTLKLPTKLES